MLAQSAILPQPDVHGRFIVLNIRDLPLDLLKEQLVRLEEGRHRLISQHPEARLVTSVAFGPELWRRLHSSSPRELKPLEAIEAKFSMPATGGDLLLHINAARTDLCFLLAHEFLEPIAAQVEVLEQVAGFRYLDSRDLTGFIDGTENPQGDEDRAEAALVGEEDAAFAGGSYVFAQRYVHHLDKWQRLKVEAQEQVIGRSKLDSVELSDEEKPANAHIARVVIEEDGEELEIVRHGLPYGESGGEMGLFFVAYVRRLSIIDRMLANMFGSAGDGENDRLLNFVTPVGGAYFFAPAQALLLDVIGAK